MGGTLFDSGDVVPRTIVVAEGHVDAVGTDDELPARGGDVTIDVQGCTILPGMVSCHVHPEYRGLSLAAGAVPITERRPGVAMAIAVSTARSLLMSGFTGYVGAGCGFSIDAQLKMAVDEGVVPGPSIRPSGAIVPLDAGEENALDAVRREAERGAQVIKVFATGGHGVPDDRRKPSRGTVLRSVVRTATDLGCLVRAHCVYRDSIISAIEDGVAIIDHGDGADETCLRLMLERGTFWVPSALFNVKLAAADDGTGDPDLRAQAQRDLQRQRESVPLAATLGVKIVLGDDYGVELLPHGPGRYSEEIVCYVEVLGCDARQVLSWATRTGAELLSLDDWSGRLEPGGRADLLVVEGNPVVDPSILTKPEHIRAVMKAGELHDLTTTLGASTLPVLVDR